MSTEPFIGEIKLFGFNFAPVSHIACQGQMLSIAQNNALFALLGTRYGGNGQTTFGIPDLQGRAPIGQGQGPGLPNYQIGEHGGAPTVSLTASNLPAHLHGLNSMKIQLQASTGNAGESSPDGTFPAVTATASYGDTATANVFTGGAVVSGSTDLSGGGQPVTVMNPYLCMNYCIAVEGIFPSRN